MNALPVPPISTLCPLVTWSAFVPDPAPPMTTSGTVVARATSSSLASR